MCRLQFSKGFLWSPNGINGTHTHTKQFFFKEYSKMCTFQMLIYIYAIIAEIEVIDNVVGIKLNSNCIPQSITSNATIRSNKERAQKCRFRRVIGSAVWHYSSEHDEINNSNLSRIKMSYVDSSYSVDGTSKYFRHLYAILLGDGGNFVFFRLCSCVCVCVLVCSRVLSCVPFFYLFYSCYWK